MQKKLFMLWKSLILCYPLSLFSLLRGLGAGCARAEVHISHFQMVKFNKLTSVFHASVLLLIMNFHITLSLSLVYAP